MEQSRIYSSLYGEISSTKEITQLSTVEEYFVLNVGVESASFLCRFRLPIVVAEMETIIGHYRLSTCRTKEVCPNNV